MAGSRVAIPKEIRGKRMFVLVLKQEVESFVEVIFKMYNSERFRNFEEPNLESQENRNVEKFTDTRVVSFDC